VSLTLKDAMGHRLSHNVYWMSPGHDFTALRSMPPAQVTMKTVKTETRGAYVRWAIQFTNMSRQLAFFLNPQVIKDGQEILPSYWSDNYFSIPAGKTVTVMVNCPLNLLAGAPPDLRLDGWNIAPLRQRIN